MNTYTVGVLLRIIADLNAITINVQDGLSEELLIKDLEEAESKLRNLRFNLFRANIEYEEREA